MVLEGYIDESYNERIFSLSSILANRLTWAYFESAWKRRLTAKNKALKNAGRPQISMVHASDLSNRKGEFEGWTVQEQIAFTQDLIGVFKRPARIKSHYLIINAYSLPLNLLVSEFPEWEREPLGPCYAVLLKFLMVEMADQYDLAKTQGIVRPIKIALIHDRSRFDAVLLRTFNKMLDDGEFSGREYFTSITPLSWQECIPLQAADFLAYENMKEADRKATDSPRAQRKSLSALLDLSSLGGKTMRFDAKTLHSMRESFERKRRI